MDLQPQTSRYHSHVLRVGVHVHVHVHVLQSSTLKLLSPDIKFLDIQASPKLLRTCGSSLVHNVHTFITVKRVCRTAFLSGLPNVYQCLSHPTLD